MTITGTINGQASDETWRTTVKPRSVPLISGEPMSSRLALLEAEAWRTNQKFLAHLIGLTRLEAENLENAAVQRQKATAAR